MKLQARAEEKVVAISRKTNKCSKFELHRMLFLWDAYNKASDSLQNMKLSLFIDTVED